MSRDQERKHPDRASIRRRRVLRWIVYRLNEQLVSARNRRRDGNTGAEREHIVRAEELAEMALAFLDEVQP